MKHEVKIVALLLGMFIATQLIGLVVIDAYDFRTTTVIENGVEKNVTTGNQLPYDLQPPEIKPEISLLSIFFSFFIAIMLFLLLTRLRADILINIWFAFVVFTTMAVSITALLYKFLPQYGLNFAIVALVIAIPLTFFKVYKKNIVVHNATEILVYPGLAAIFVPILRPWSIILLLFAISAYDMWAVWRSSFMVNLAKYQIKNLKIFTGFFVPYMSKKDAEKLEKMKVKVVKGRSMSAKMKKKGDHKIRVSLALLGGGDVAFPLIFAGVVMRASGLTDALIIVAGATIALIGLFLYSKKGKFYPAMPFITAGCLIAWLVGLIV